MQQAKMNLTVSKRADTGKGPNKKLRKKGLVPCILYGHGIEPVTLSAELKQIYSVAHHPSILTLKFGSSDDTREVLIKDVQYNYLNSSIIHVDFQEVRMDEVITAEIPLEVTGHPAGLQQGGQLDQIMHSIEVQCLPKDLPDRILYDVSSLGLGDSVSIGDLPLPEGVKATYSDPKTVAIHVILPKLAQEETEETEEEAVVAKPSGEPEVITKGKKDEQE